MSTAFQVTGNNNKALFTLKIHRGDGMALIAMNWKDEKPPKDFVGFGIEYKEPGGKKFYALKNRLCFPDSDGSVNPNILSSLLSPIQKFRWVHFPRNAEMKGKFTYRVTPVFMNDQNELSYGEYQTAAMELRRETYPGQLNVAFTRGFVSSQAFVDRYQKNGAIETLLPPKSKFGLTFQPTHPDTKKALEWMGFEARDAVLEVLDKAIADTTAQVRVVAYDLSEPEVVNRLVKLKKRLMIIIDDEGEHGEKTSGETQAQKILEKSAGKANVKRQSMASLQHNKTIVVDGRVKRVVCGSTNFSWRGLYVQANNAIVLNGADPVKIFMEAFDNYWKIDVKPVATFGATRSARWNDLKLKGINAKVAFSPHIASNALLQDIADDISKNTTSSLFYSLAFLSQTPGVIRQAIKKQASDKNIFVYGMADKKVGELQLRRPDGNVSPVFPTALVKADTPEPFKSEVSGGGGNRMHHKFLVIDFDKPTARVYMGSYNFSRPADTKNGENLLLIKDRRIAVSYMIEAIRIFDHYHFRVVQKEAKKKRKVLALTLPPRKTGDKAWWVNDYTNARRIRDRELFS
jgi:phosphatidylserine/phosphatidylglycerophosphate/cardiolipin synthase-like enzyme